MTDHWVDLPLCPALFNVSFYGFFPECEGRVNSRSCSKHRRWAQHPAATEKAHQENKAQELLNTGPAKAAAALVYSQSWQHMLWQQILLAPSSSSIWSKPPANHPWCSWKEADSAVVCWYAAWLLMLVVLATWTPFKSEEATKFICISHKTVVERKPLSPYWPALTANSTKPRPFCSSPAWAKNSRRGKITFLPLEKGERNIPVPVYYLQSVIAAIIPGNIDRAFYYTVWAANSSGLTGYVPAPVYYAVCCIAD